MSALRAPACSRGGSTCEMPATETRGGERGGVVVAKHKGSATHTPSPQPPQSAPFPKPSSGEVPPWRWESRSCETCQGGPLAPEPLRIPQAPHPHPSVLHAHYLLSTKGDWSCKCSSKTHPEPPPPTFQPERRPRPHLPGNAGVQQGGLLRRRAARLQCPVLGGGVARLSLALALRACLSGCLGPSLVLPLCVFVGDGRRCPLGLRKGSGSIEGSWKSGGDRKSVV